MAGRLHLALLAFGALNTILYSSLLPLWDGFDEPFHFAVVQHLARTHQLPVTGETVISGEVRRSLELAPASHLVQRNVPFVTTFADFSVLPPEERAKRRHELIELRDSISALAPGGFNYEAQQAPLAHAILALGESWWRDLPLVQRVFRLRLFGGLLAAFAVWSLTLRITARPGIPQTFRLLALFLIFSSQVFYATVSHVANDWLTVVLFSLIVACAMEFFVDPRRSKAISLALSVAAGLLTKASLLTAVPLAAGLTLLLLAKRRLKRRDAFLLLAIALVIPAPWYLRNFTRYGNLTGLIHLAGGGVSLTALGQIALGLPWRTSIVTAAKAAIWTGNNSDTAFNSTTVWVALLLLSLATILWLWSAVRKQWRPPEAVLATSLVCYIAGLAYSVVLFYWASKGVGIAAVPWYVEVMAPPAICGLSLGLARAGRLGRGVAVLMVWTWTYLIAATYLLKLIPFYSGFTGRVQAGAIWSHYMRSTYWREILANTAMRPTGEILGLTAAVVLLALGIALLLSRQILRSPSPSSRMAA